MRASTPVHTGVRAEASSWKPRSLAVAWMDGQSLSARPGGVDGQTVAQCPAWWGGWTDSRSVPGLVGWWGGWTDSRSLLGPVGWMDEQSLIARPGGVDGRTVAQCPAWWGRWTDSRSMPGLVGWMKLLIVIYCIALGHCMATQCTDRAKLDLSVMLLPYDDAVFASLHIIFKFLR